MRFSPKRWVVSACLAGFSFAILLHFLRQISQFVSGSPRSPIEKLIHPGFFHAKFRWKDVPQRYPVQNLTALPSGPLLHQPRIQYDFQPESEETRSQREARQAAVLEAFMHSWEGYKTRAWLQDELSPVTGGSKNPFGGWGATLIDSLDTLWIMGLQKEFIAAVAELKNIDFATTPMDNLNTFETTIRYLGGLLSAYDVSGHQHKILLSKAVDLGEMLYHTFDTVNRMPVTYWDWKNAALGQGQESGPHSLVAEVGSLTLEFTRLSQLAGDDKWYDAIARVTDVFEQQLHHTGIPGLFPTMMDTRAMDFSKDFTYTLGAMSDSLYEYFPKQHIMLGGRSEQYRNLYEHALQAAKEQLFFRPLNPDNQQLLIPGTVLRHGAGHITMVPEGQHLGCFAGGMVALAAKAFQQSHDLEIARQLVDGCLWAYESMPSGIMPESFRAAPCAGYEADNCTWSEQRWYDAVYKHANRGGSPPGDPSKDSREIISQQKLAPGFTEISDARYNLRPEAIESLFVLYRITGDRTLQDKAWNMFQAISNVTKTAFAYAGIDDVTKTEPRWIDTMESFWTAETLKYFYLIFSEPHVISLDEYVLNTEAHPLLRPTE